jgi:hypothetical protein
MSRSTYRTFEPNRTAAASSTPPPWLCKPRTTPSRTGGRRAAMLTASLDSENAEDVENAENVESLVEVFTVRARPLALNHS